MFFNIFFISQLFCKKKLWIKRACNKDFSFNQSFVDSCIDSYLTDHAVHQSTLDTYLSVCPAICPPTYLSILCDSELRFKPLVLVLRISPYLHVWGPLSKVHAPHWKLLKFAIHFTEHLKSPWKRICLEWSLNIHYWYYHFVSDVLSCRCRGNNPF